MRDPALTGPTRCDARLLPTDSCEALAMELLRTNLETEVRARLRYLAGLLLAAALVVDFLI